MLLNRSLRMPASTGPTFRRIHVIMNITSNLSLIAVVLASALPAFPQSVTPVTLLIDVQDHVEYQDDISDVTKFATIPTLTPAVNFRTFSVATVLADVVAVNGQPAKGVYTAQARALGASPTATAGDAIADIQRAALREEAIEILNSDGTSIGTISSLGLSGGSHRPAPRRPKPPPISQLSAAPGLLWEHVGFQAPDQALRAFPRDRLPLRRIQPSGA
jgi:hypothetical protein